MYDFLKKIYMRMMGIIPYLKMRFWLKGSKIDFNVRVGKSCHFRGGSQASFGKGIVFGDNCFIEIIGSKSRDKLCIGNDVHVTGNIFISCMKKITIGDNVLIGNNVRVYDSNHGMNPELLSYEKQPFTTKEVEVGGGSWIGDNVMILAGASIGEKCIIGAGSVVTGIIPAYSIAVGVPAKVKKTWDRKAKEWKMC